VLRVVADRGHVLLPMASWRRTYWAVWTANLITAIGMMSFLPFFPSLLEELGLRDRAEVATWAGVIFGAAPLAATLMSPVWGSVGDRIGRKLMICRSMLAIAFFVGLMGFATSPWELLALRLGQGLFSGFIPPSVTLVSVLAPPDRQGRIAADLGTALPIGGMLGPLVGGLIAASYGHSAVFRFVTVAALISLALVVFLAEEDESLRRRDEGRLSVGKVLSGTLRDQREVWRNRKLRSGLVLLFFLQFGLGGTNPVLELHVRELPPGPGFEESLAGRAASWLPASSEQRGEGDPAGAHGSSAAGVEPGWGTGVSEGVLALATSLLFAGMALANLLAMPLWGRTGDRLGHQRALQAVAIGSILSLLVQAAASAYGLLFAGRVLMGLTMAGAGPVAFGLAASEIPVERRGGAMGAVFSARTLAVAVGGASGGYMAGTIGVRGFMLVAAGLIGVALLGMARSRS